MPNPASGLFKQLLYKAEATYGTIPSQASGQLLRRVKSTIDMEKDTYRSNEIKTSMQVSDFRHGVRRVRGQVTGDLSAKTYADFFGAALKRAFGATSAMASLSITISGSGPTYTVARASGSWLTDGVKIGMSVRLTAGSFNAANLNNNLLVTAVTASNLTVMTLNGSALVAEGPIASATTTVVGKSTYVPQSGHTDASYAMEHWYTDQVQSELFLGCKVGQIALNLPPTGLAQFTMDVVGKDYADTLAKRNAVAATSQYFTSPTAATTTGAMAAVNGVLRIGGTTVATLTNLSLTIAPTLTGDPVVGSNLVPFQFPGTVNVTGQATAYFDSVTLRDAFVNETEVDLLAAFTADNTAASDFITIHLPRIKLGGASKDDGEGGLIQTIPFQALESLTGGSGVSTERTTIQIQDAQA